LTRDVWRKSLRKEIYLNDSAKKLTAALSTFQVESELQDAEQTISVYVGGS